MTDIAQPGRRAREAPGGSSALRPGWRRYFLFALSFYFVLVAIVGFAPSYLDYRAGTFPIDPVVHLHGALMSAWLGIFVAQTFFAANATMERHRALGYAATGLAAIIWLMMWEVTGHALRPPAQFPRDEFLYDVLLAQLSVIFLFPVFFVSAYITRAAPDTHRRFMILATLVLLQAAVDRMYWLPHSGLPGFWDHALRLYVLLLAPLYAFDLLTIRRIHRVTFIGTATIVGAHVVIAFLWGNPAWHTWASGIWASVR